RAIVAVVRVSVGPAGEVWADRLPGTPAVVGPVEHLRAVVHDLWVDRVEDHRREPVPPRERRPVGEVGQRLAAVVGAVAVAVLEAGVDVGRSPRRTAGNEMPRHRYPTGARSPK